MDWDVERLIDDFEKHVNTSRKPPVFSFGMALYVSTDGQYPIPIEIAYRQFMVQKCPYTVRLKFPVNNNIMLLHLLATARDLIGWIGEEELDFQCTRFFFSNATDACVFKLTFG